MKPFAAPLALLLALHAISPPSVRGRRLGEADSDVPASNSASNSTSTSETAPGPDLSLPCPALETAPDFDLDGYVSAPWYVQEQAETNYLPPEQNYCVTASYARMERSWWGYTVEVRNRSQDSRGREYGGTLAAAQVDPGKFPAMLEVAPRFLPRFLAGPYWVLAYREADASTGTKGYALVSGGQPTERHEGGCRTRTTGFFRGFSGGLWIFTREAERDEALVAEVRALARDEFGLDVSILNEVRQGEECRYGEEEEEEEEVVVVVAAAEPSK